jgi:hypothetical protein
MMVSEPAAQRPVEKVFLFNGPALWPALLRIAIGFSVLPFFSWLTNGDESSWHLWTFFLAVLVALRIVPAVLRHVIPFSQTSKAHWFKLRVLAKRYDSYQWRKLLWFGFGFAGYLAVRGGGSQAQAFLALGSVVAGGLGEYAWQSRVRADPVLQSELRLEGLDRQ